MPEQMYFPFHKRDVSCVAVEIKIGRAAAAVHVHVDTDFHMNKPRLR